MKKISFGLMALFLGLAFTSCVNNIDTVAVTGVSLNQTSATLFPGNTLQLTATVQPNEATNKSVRWSSSNNKATVSSTGKVTIPADATPGSVTITVRTVDGGKTATCTITVTTAHIAVTGVTVSPTTTSLAVGGTRQLTATIAPATASNKNVTWSSNNEAVATINASGLITAKAIGTATITVRTTDGNKTATCTVTVTAEPMIPALFVHKVLVEDLTGTWCGYCTRMFAAMDKVLGLTNKVVEAYIHTSDQWNLSAKDPWVTKFEAAGVPTAYINRTTKWTGNEPSPQVPINMIQSSSKYGIAISSTLGATSGTIEVSFYFREAVTAAKCVVYVLEDGLIADQSNFYIPGNGIGILYGGANPIKNFVHRNVVRASVTHILGNDIPADKSIKDSMYKATFSANYTSTKIANLLVMAMLLDNTGKVLNVQLVPANQTVDFEAAL